MASNAAKKIESMPNALAKSFLEVQFPASLISKENYKEKEARSGQTLTNIGKWWGRKQLILVRSLIISSLVPASIDSRMDREVFLRILTMDNDGLWRRKRKSLPVQLIFQKLPSAIERNRYFAANSSLSNPHWLEGLSQVKREEAEKKVFFLMNYDEKLEFCCRPEEIDGPSSESWKVINAHLGTSAKSIPDLVDELGYRRFGHKPSVGDAFCGGGSITFEAARIGCNAYGADINPLAALLTWASLTLIGGTKELRQTTVATQLDVFRKVDKQIAKWGIEHNEKGWRADVFLYCFQTVCPASGLLVPLAPSWVISEKSKVCAVLKENKAKKTYDIIIIENASDEQMKTAASGTVKNGKLVCPKTGETFEISGLRGDNRLNDGSKKYGLRMWDNNDITPRETDILQERMYCIRWVEPIKNGKKERSVRHYCAVTDGDLKREAIVENLLSERFIDWQTRGIIPSGKVESGAETDRLPRERGWTHWHHLFNPRQLLTLGTLCEMFLQTKSDDVSSGVAALTIGKLSNWNSRLCRWNPKDSSSKDSTDNKALNTLYNYASRGMSTLISCGELSLKANDRNFSGTVECVDAREIRTQCDLWITDPPYADAVQYHEITELFLRFLPALLKRSFPSWTCDTKSALAVKGVGTGFRQSMTEVYSNLVTNTQSNGIQIVMFTHQNPAVWADLCLILWASGLQVVNAWCVATETEALGRDHGNHVKGTVCLLLRKRSGSEEIFADEIITKVEDEVRKTVKEMQAIDVDSSESVFTDLDFQLSAYSGALRVLTNAAVIEGVHVQEALANEHLTNTVANVIAQAVKIASEQLIPAGFSKSCWARLTPIERYFLRGLELEVKGDLKNSSFQELARTLGAKDYSSLFQSTKPNAARLLTASEMKRKVLESDGFGNTLVRKCLLSIFIAVSEERAGKGKDHLKETLEGQYWDSRQTLIAILRYISNKCAPLSHWTADADAAKLIAGLLEQDSV